MNAEEIKKLLAADLNRELFEVIKEVEKTGLLRVVLITDGPAEFRVMGTESVSQAAPMLHKALENMGQRAGSVSTVGEAVDVLMTVARNAPSETVDAILGSLRENFPDYFNNDPEEIRKLKSGIASLNHSIEQMQKARATLNEKVEIMRDALQHAEMKLRSVATRLDGQGCGSIPNECRAVATTCRDAIP